MNEPGSDCFPRSCRPALGQGTPWFGPGDELSTASQPSLPTEKYELRSAWCLHLLSLWLLGNQRMWIHQKTLGQWKLILRPGLLGLFQWKRKCLWEIILQVPLPTSCTQYDPLVVTEGEEIRERMATLKEWCFSAQDVKRASWWQTMHPCFIKEKLSPADTRLHRRSKLHSCRWKQTRNKLFSKLGFYYYIDPKLHIHDNYPKDLPQAHKQIICKP